MTQRRQRATDRGTATGGETFGQVLRRFRRAADLTQTALARKVFVNQSTLSRYEEDRVPVSSDVACRLDKALGAGGVLAAKATAPKQPPDFDPLADGATPEMTTLKRRLFVRTIMAASVGVAAAETPESFARLLDGLNNLDQVPHHVGLAEVEATEAAAAELVGLTLDQRIRLMRSTLQWSRELLNQNMTDPIRDRLSSAVGLLADRLGWEIYDRGQPGEAAKMLTFALDHAARGSDRDLRAHVMLDLSTVMSDSGHPGHGVDILRFALGDERVSSAERANLHFVAAQCAAPAGQHESALRHIAHAEEALTRSDPALAPDWARRITLDPGHLDGAMVLALDGLGDTDRTRQHAESALATLHPERIRTRFRMLTRVTTAHLRNGDRAIAEEHGRQLLAAAEPISTSVRVRRDLRMLRAQAAKFGAPDLATAVSNQLGSAV